MNFEEKLNHGFELLQEKDIDHSLDTARELQKENPEAHEPFYLEALIFQQLNQYEMSEKAIDIAIELAGEKPSYMNMRGNLYMQQEKLAEAESDFDKAIADGDLPNAHRNMVVLMLLTGRGQEASPYLIVRITANLHDAEHWILLGAMIKRVGSEDKARTYYEQDLKIDPVNEYAMSQLEET